MNDYKLAKINFKKIRKNISSKPKSDSRLVKEIFKTLRPNDLTLESDDFSLSWKVSSDLDFSDLIEGDFIGAVDQTEIKVKVVYTASDCTELRLEIEGKPFRLNEDGEVKFSAITHF